MDEGLHPLTLEEFHAKAPNQVHLFYSQSAARKAVYKASMRKFYSKHIPRDKYHEFKCKFCLLYGHIKWSCLRYVCPQCKMNCGHQRENCITL